MAEVNLTGFGYVQSEDVTGNKTLDLGDCGVVQNATATCVVTLPATSAKNRFIVRVGAEGITVSISPAAADKIWGAGATAGTDNKDLIFTSQAVGSYVELAGDGTDGYAVVRYSGTSTFEA